MAGLEKKTKEWFDQKKWRITVPEEAGKLQYEKNRKNCCTRRTDERLDFKKNKEWFDQKNWRITVPKELINGVKELIGNRIKQYTAIWATSNDWWWH